jgi:hypothetical protein
MRSRNGRISPPFDIQIAATQEDGTKTHPHFRKPLFSSSLLLYGNRLFLDGFSGKGEGEGSEQDRRGKKKTEEGGGEKRKTHLPCCFQLLDLSAASLRLKAQNDRMSSGLSFISSTTSLNTASCTSSSPSFPSPPFSHQGPRPSHPNTISCVHIVSPRRDLVVVPLSDSQHSSTVAIRVRYWRKSG